jgi:methyl-accepting chemotaxis protein
MNLRARINLMTTQVAALFVSSAPAAHRKHASSEEDATAEHQPSVLRWILGPVAVIAAGRALARSRLKRTRVRGRPAAGLALEETSVSVEELSSKTSHAADTVRSAKRTAGYGCPSVDDGTGQMKTINAVMDASRDLTAKRTIERVSFQANTRRPNAVRSTCPSVAAACFAVVADEVRLLSQRCAAAAKETARKIEASASRCEHGTEISAYVARSFAGIQERILEIENIVAEMALEGQQRSRGIGQIDTCEPTPSGVDTAWESARAAEKLRAQAAALNDLVASLQRLVGGAVRAPEVCPDAMVAPGRSLRKPPDSGHRLNRPLRPECANLRTPPVHRHENSTHRQGKQINGHDRFFRS